MLLNLRDVLASENLCVSFDYTMDLREEEFYGEHPFQQPIHVQGKLENKADVFYLRAQVVAPVDTHCARCGVPVQVQKELEIDLVIASSLSNEEGSDDIYVVEGETFDLDEIIREELHCNTYRKKAAGTNYFLTNPAGVSIIFVVSLKEVCICAAQPPGRFSV